MYPCIHLINMFMFFGSLDAPWQAGASGSHPYIYAAVSGEIPP